VTFWWHAPAVSSGVPERGRVARQGGVSGLRASANEDVVREAETPKLERLDGAHEGMTFGFPVLTGVTVLRLVTATHVTTRQT
jgi:hypothetical protein